MADEPHNPERMTWPRMRDNHGELAAWMLHLVDGSPNRLGIIEIPHEAVRTEEQTDELEDVVRREFNRAKRDRPGLAVALTPATPDYPDAAVLVSVHEHRWVGGECVHGCGERRDS